MKELYKILNEIKDTSSKTGKENILRENIENEYLIETLKFLFDDLIVTGISSKKISKPINAIEPNNTDLKALLKYLRNHNSGKDRDIATVKGYINTYKSIYGEDVANMVKGIVTKDYPMGISKVTINKVFGKGFIYKFDVRKGSKFEGKLKPNTEYLQTVKLDGIRSIITITNSGVEIRGRSGKLIEGLVDIEQVFLQHYKEYEEDLVFDGELLAIDETGNLPNDELFRKTSQILRKKGNKTGVQFVMFDTLPYYEFIDGKSKKTYVERRTELEGLKDELGRIQYEQGYTEVINIVDILYRGNDLSEIQKVQTKAENDGYEGTMLDEANAFYEAKRTKSLLKFKTFHTVDLRCLRVEEHIRGNKVGNIVVDYKGYELGVGSGFSDKDRKLFWEQKDKIENKIVEIGYFEESSNDKGGLSLRFPTFKLVRNDKDEVSYN
ncbi:ATP-dependent DNA ligase [Staphylococcus saprophyticus]|uniref:ATP-dependent DNA ligase n=1 Tax=Staphylococcus saprophyticus TaxID=29385 RepID=UPI0024C2640A|nr:ATP-dependent DNA ligase [Staphylococcus saprophyticus]MDK1672811.1 ATP-dependent DNA ligase [Staphylococcus saprophyticus]